jgi:hypothetical protein
MPHDGIVTLDNGMYKIWFARNYRTRVANTLLLDNALATMGAGLPSAIAASLLNPKRRVLAVCGDGGFMMNSQEMETAVRLGLNLVVLVLEDNTSVFDIVNSSLVQTLARFPARAGMNRLLLGNCWGCTQVPRTRGDESGSQAGLGAVPPLPLLSAGRSERLSIAPVGSHTTH